MLVVMTKWGNRVWNPTLAVAIGVSILAMTFTPCAGGQSEIERRAGREARLSGMRSEIVRLESEVAELRSRERGVIGELERV